jgi:hypothetical protein
MHNPDAVPTAAKIYQSHVHPPHFKVLEHQEVWDTFQGRNNLFHAIFLWVFAVQTRLDGFIGQVHPSSSSNCCYVYVCVYVYHFSPFLTRAGGLHRQTQVHLSETGLDRVIRTNG